MKLPPNGSDVVIVRKPAGSYSTEGDTYRVSYLVPDNGSKRFDVHLWSLTRNCGTFDRAVMWERAEWVAA